VICRKIFVALIKIKKIMTTVFWVIFQRRQLQKNMEKGLDLVVLAMATSSRTAVR
jgi:hypothetical protein